jgi:4-hydroxy-2-oxoheptanedioate aldolase
MRKNRILQKLRDGRAVLITCNASYASPKIVEMIGLLDFDGVWIDMEHQDYSFDQVFNMAMACRATGIESMVRIRKGDYWTYSRPLEAGATGLMVPHCRSGAEAEKIVRFSRFTPMGLRGMDGAEVAADYGLAPMADYMAHANREIFIAVQIEDREAVEKLDDIASVDGIDILFVGPADLSQSYGIPMQFDDPLMLRAIEQVAEAATKHGKWWGIPCGSIEQAEHYYQMGARFLSSGVAVSLLQQGLHHIRETFDGILSR